MKELVKIYPLNYTSIARSLWPKLEKAETKQTKPNQETRKEHYRLDNVESAIMS